MATEVKYERNYERQDKLSLTIPKGVIIVGCGGTGTWTALGLLLVGTREFILMDEDDLATHNLNRLPYHPENVGLQKTRVLKNMLESIEPSVDVDEIWRMAAPETEDDAEVSFEDVFRSNEYPVVDCTDNLKTQQYLAKLCKTHKRPYLRVGCNDKLVFVGNKVPMGGFASDMEPGYGTPSWVSPPMLAGAFAVQALCSAPDIEIVRSMK